MPGLALADVFVRIWAQLQAGNRDAALKLFSELTPYLQFSLQTFEQFHHAEKGLLVRRGVIKNAIVRPVTVELDSDAKVYLDLLTKRLLSTIKGIEYK
jgi:dihydrodipicolinate synthase/N-acetylneuraminate lyase